MALIIVCYMSFPLITLPPTICFKLIDIGPVYFPYAIHAKKESCMHEVLIKVYL